MKTYLAGKGVCFDDRTEKCMMSEPVTIAHADVQFLEIFLKFRFQIFQRVLKSDRKWSSKNDQKSPQIAPK